VKSSAKPCGLTSCDLYEDRTWNASKELALHMIKSVYFLECCNPCVSHHYHSQRWCKFKAAGSHTQFLQVSCLPTLSGQLPCNFKCHTKAGSSP